MTHKFKEGDMVRIVGVPPNQHEDTQAVFEQCRGHVFRVDGFDKTGWARLFVESVTGAVVESVYADPGSIELA